MYFFLSYVDCFYWSDLIYVGGLSNFDGAFTSDAKTCLLWMHSNTSFNDNQLNLLKIWPNKCLYDFTLSGFELDCTSFRSLTMG